MNHDEFVGKVQHLAELPSRGYAEMIIRATLETLRERLQPQVAEHIAAQLPQEIGRALLSRARFEHLTLDQFYRRIAAREDSDVEKAVFHARCVLEVMGQALTPGAFRKLETQLPHDFKAALLPSPARREEIRTGGLT